MSTQKRFISQDEALSILEAGSYGILSTALSGEPYGVPVNYFYSKQGDCVFFHCALTGRKLNNIKNNARVSFTVVGWEKAVPEKLTTCFESVILSGNAQIVTDEVEKTEKLLLFCKKFAPDFNNIDKVIAKMLPKTAVVKIMIERIKGKRNENI